jgi:hypothetical protein
MGAWSKHFYKFKFKIVYLPYKRECYIGRKQVNETIKIYMYCAVQDRKKEGHKIVPDRS